MTHDKMVRGLRGTACPTPGDQTIWTLYFLHYPIPEEEVSIQERMETIGGAEESGKIHAIGLSTTPWRDEKAAMEYGQVDVISPATACWRYDEELLKFSREKRCRGHPWRTLWGC